MKHVKIVNTKGEAPRQLKISIHLNFKKTIVNLYHSGKSYSQIHAQYGVSSGALSKRIKLFSEVKIDDDTVITAQQIKDLQKRNALLAEENLILKKPLQYLLHTQTKTDCC